MNASLGQKYQVEQLFNSIVADFDINNISSEWFGLEDFSDVSHFAKSLGRSEEFCNAVLYKVPKGSKFLPARSVHAHISILMVYSPFDLPGLIEDVKLSFQRTYVVYERWDTMKTGVGNEYL